MLLLRVSIASQDPGDEGLYLSQAPFSEMSLEMRLYSLENYPLRRDYLVSRNRHLLKELSWDLPCVSKKKCWSGKANWKKSKLYCHVAMHNEKQSESIKLRRTCWEISHMSDFLCG